MTKKKLIELKRARVDKVINLIIKNIEPTLATTIYNSIIENDTVNNQREMEKYVSLYLNLKSHNIHSYNYWGNRGWTEEEIKKKRPKLKNKHSPMVVKNWLNKINPITDNNYTTEEAKYKIRSFRKVNVEYWIERGHSEQETIIKVSEHQIEQNKKYVYKQKYTPQKYEDRTTTQLKY